ncbi:MAG: DNA mismatch repair endonuclease MutL [Pseudomonadota bacterium]
MKTTAIKQRIKPLSIQLANQIAAGEVVERPASVLKELLENSIDAGSDNIEIDISHGGKSLIRIKDNGCGINKEDLSLAVSRHATSKISVIDDLKHILSLGFRGEALASISSISRLSISSKSQHSDRAWSIDTGSETDFANYKAEVQPAALSTGTLIEVYDLFYNTPARRKFLKTDKTEFRYLEEVFKRIALSHFDVSFKLSHNQKLLKKITAVKPENCLSRVAKLLGENLVKQLVEVDYNSFDFADLGCLHLSGWISKPAYYRAQADQQYFYINGRYVRDKLLNHALRQAYQDSLPAQQYATYILYLTIDPAYVDVNVHPSKHEVRFSQARMVHDFIVSSLGCSLSPVLSADFQAPMYGEPEQNQRPQPDKEPQPDNSPEQKSRINYVSPGSHTYQSKAYPNSNHFYQQQKVAFAVKDELQALHQLYNRPVSAANNAVEGIRPLQTELDAEFVFKGQILTQLGSILVAQDNAKLYLIDCIKAAKIINAMVLDKQLPQHIYPSITQPGNPVIEAQQLLIPEQLVLGREGCDILQKWQTSLNLFAIEFTLSGPESILLRAVPKLPFDLDFSLLLLSLIELLAGAKINSAETILPEQNIIVVILKKISQALNLEQDFNNNKQQLLLYYLAENIAQEFKADGQTIAVFKNCYRVFDSNDLNKIISIK